MTRVTFPKLILFDLDGTLIEPLDFEPVKRVLGVESPILVSLSKDPRKEEKMEILKEFEIKHSYNANLMPYAEEILSLIEGLGIKKGVITRNCSESVEIVKKRFGLEFDFVFTRDNCDVKPSPKPIKLALRFARVKSDECLMVGDYTFDILAGKRAGVKTALILNGKNHRVYRDHAHLIDFVLKSLRDLKRLIV